MFHIYTKVVNPDCGFLISGYISKYTGNPSTYHFTNIDELAYAALDFYGGAIKIYKQGDKEAIVFRGFREIKNLRDHFKGLDNGKYDIIFIKGDVVSESMTIEIDKNKSCKEIKDSNPYTTTDNILLGTMSRNALKQPLNKNAIEFTPAYSNGKIRGGKIFINHNIPNTRKLSIGLGYRQFSGINESHEFYIPKNQRLESYLRFWPSLYNGVYMAAGVHIYNTFDISYSASIGIQGRMNRFSAVKIGASLSKTTIESYYTPYYASFNVSLSIMYKTQKEKEFYRDYKNNKQKYKEFKRKKKLTF